MAFGAGAWQQHFRNCPIGRETEMLVAELAELDKKRIRVILEGGEDFVLYRGEVKRYSIQEGEELPQGQ